MKIRGRSLVVCLGMFCLSAGYGQQYTIKTLAGNGSAAFAGDNGDPAAAQLNSPHAVALAPNGDLYIADTGNHRIRKISGGTITTIAGTGTLGFSGDKAAATAATLNAPSGLAFDAAGNLYIADTGNNVIRKISGGTITTVAGQAGQGGGLGGDGGAATLANLNGPTAVAVNGAGELYIADTGDDLIRRVDNKGIITSVVGTAATDKRLSHPNGLWFDRSGALYIGDSDHNSVPKWVPPALSLFAGNQTAGFSGDGGPALRAQLNKPVGVTMDAAGNIYIADTNNGRIRKIATDGTITTIAGRGAGPYSGDPGSATDAYLNFPRSITVSSDGTVYVADTANHAIRVLTPYAATLSISGVTNAASFAARISPGALASVFGNGFGALFLADAGFNWPTNAKGVTVKVNGVASPIYFVSPGQINFQVPWATPTSGTVNVFVQAGTASSNSISVPVGTAAPGLFELGGNQAAVVNNADGLVNGPSSPAAAGSTIQAFLTGSGPVSPAALDGRPASTTSLTYMSAASSAKIGDAAATIQFAGLAPGFIGLVQMNIVVPSGLAPGVYPLSITIDGQTANSATIAVK